MVLHWLVLFVAIGVAILRFWGRMLVPGVRRVIGRTSRREGRGDVGQGSTVGASFTGFYLRWALLVPLVFYAFSVEVFFYHYFYVLIGFMTLLVAVITLPSRGVLLGFVVAQALISLAFLSYVHENGGVVHGEFGYTYARQMRR